MTVHVEAVVIGAGVVGLAVARELARAGREVVVLEAAPGIGSGASSRNSEVIHSGIYYPPGSLKARLCVAGRDLLYDYCREHGIEHLQTGKLVVATSNAEVRTLAAYRERARMNGAGELEPLTGAEATALEPELRCMAALHAPRTGIVDSHAYLLALRRDLEDAGGQVVTRSAVEGGSFAEGTLALRCAGEELHARAVVLAAGLDAQHLARRIAGVPSGSIPACHYARGHYFVHAGQAPFTRPVYPVADEASLGIHATVDLTGRVKFGPDVEWIDAVDYTFDERRRAGFVAAIRRWFPALEAARLEPGYTGVRVKLAGPGEPPGDFLVSGPRDHGIAGFVALYGIESPGLTASLALARHVAELLQ